MVLRSPKSHFFGCEIVFSSVPPGTSKFDSRTSPPPKVQIWIRDWEKNDTFFMRKRRKEGRKEGGGKERRERKEEGGKERRKKERKKERRQKRNVNVFLGTSNFM